MNQSSTNPKIARTTMVPVTTMEEMPLLAEAERASLVASLKDAEASVKAGQYTEHDSGAFVDHLMAVRNAAKQSSPA